MEGVCGGGGVGSGGAFVIVLHTLKYCVMLPSTWNQFS